ncbi:GerAB/ArcD/ProY family transporter [Paenibacillus sp. MMS20-IR301]|uniref:GerAB/ArcD/ProY family transporter n=1 Tax=Paenibacillus sp. MMS20-IR301 TaxID=2895946 RepID=UPI0028E8737D|nr:GerAB/ArcD/ProY family transporter [Paenibacillus sp. MMS20-IR301]WNS42566.1 GerAB/ArcD/ProY family transporter [Paenibacillus sp. MMS20-IR301]
MNTLINIINFTPRELIDARFDGAQSSILVAVAVGTLFLYLFSKVINKFPGQGLPEIFSSGLPKLLASPLILVYAFLWFMAGALILLSFVDITLRFISPDTGPYAVLLGFLAVVCLCSRIDSLSLLYGLEITLGITVPLIIYTMVKAVISPDISWDAILQVMTHSLHAPDMNSIAAASFTFSGYINMAIFNRVFHGLKVKHLWILSLEGLLVLAVSFFVPIGYHGTIGVERHVYTWFTTADSLRVEAFLIERMLYIFYFAYITLSLVSTIIQWHVGKELLLSLLPSSDKQPKRKLRQEITILVLFAAGTLLMLRLDQYALNLLGVFLLHIRWYGELLLIILLCWCFWKVRRQRA